MTAFVIDCSVAITWCFRDEATPQCDALLERLGKDDAAAPALWPLELGNVLIMAERRGRITSAAAAEFLALVEGLAILIDEETPRRALHEGLALARAHRLTLYDAAYLELAMRLGAPLATRDAELRRAATNLGMEVLPA